MEEEWMTLREAAELLRVSYPTVIRWTRGKDGTPPRLVGFKLGHRTVRVRRADVLAMVAASPAPGEADAIIARARHNPHPTDTGPGWVDADGNPARVVLCPECGQMEYWTERECTDHGQCRASNAPCWCEVRP